MDSWWRGLPARAWSTTFQNDGRTAGRMPTAPWEASPRAVLRAQRQRQRQGQCQGQRGSRRGLGHRIRPPVTGSVTDRGAPEHKSLRGTGLPSRSALVAPPLRLAALRWRGAIVVLGRCRPPPSVSTAFFVPVSRFSVTRLPRIATLENVPTQVRGVSSTFSRSGTSHRCVTARTPRGTRFSGPAGHENGCNGDALRLGPTGAVPGARRSLAGSTHSGASSAAPGIRHARSRRTSDRHNTLP
jgi:hypothetical protein